MSSSKKSNPDHKQEARHPSAPVRHGGHSRSTPYPASRLAPPIPLVDLAKEISQAENLVNTRVTSKLDVIARQIKTLQQQAREVLEQAKTDQQLHGVTCNFSRQPGKIYHLYQKSNQQRYFSMLAPDDWREHPPHEYLGSYRLENDMSWTDINQQQDDGDIQAQIARLLETLHDE